MPKTTYSVVYHCANCFASSIIELPIGELVPGKAQCLVCGCETAYCLRRDFERAAGKLRWKMLAT